MSIFSNGLTIGGKHTYNDFNLLMSSYKIPEPEPKVEKVDIPFSSGSIDLSEVTGEVNYQDRTGLEFIFSVRDDGHANFAQLVQNISMHLHGKKLQMISDYDPNYFYMVRLEVNPQKTSRLTGQITLSGTAEPFKYAVRNPGEDWEWDPFDFETGVIMTLENLSPDASTGAIQIPISTTTLGTVPEFVVTAVPSNSSGLFIDWNGERHYMPTVGKYYFPQIRIDASTTLLTVYGRGTFSINFRGRFL